MFWLIFRPTDLPILAHISNVKTMINPVKVVHWSQNSHLVFAIVWIFHLSIHSLGIILFSLKRLLRKKRQAHTHRHTPLCRQTFQNGTINSRSVQGCFYASDYIEGRTGSVT